MVIIGNDYEINLIFESFVVFIVITFGTTISTKTLILCFLFEFESVFSLII